MNKLHIPGYFLSILYSVIVVCITWEIAAFIAGPERFPDVVATVQAMARSLNADHVIEAQGGGAHGFLPHVISTINSFLIGFSSGGLIGFLIALVFYQLPHLRSLTNSTLEFFRVLPPLLVVPFAVCMFKSTEMLPAATVALYTAFTVCVYASNALRNIPANYAILSKLLGSTRFRRIFDVQLPAIVPGLFGGLRVSCVLGLGIAIVTEYLAAPSGIGRVMKFAMSFSRIDLIFVGVVWVVLIALVMEGLISLAMAPLLRWTYRES